MRQRLLELGKVLCASRRRLQPGILGARQLFARFAQQRLQAHDVGRQDFGGRDESGQLECALHRLHLRRHRRADSHEIQHLAPQPVGDLAAAFSDAADLEVDARTQLLDAEAPIQAAFDDALEQRSHRPPERAQAALRRAVLDPGDGVAHDCRAGVLAAQPREHAALVQATLLHHVRRQPVRRDRFARRNAWRARRQVRIEKISGCRRLEAARKLHRLVFGIELERYRRRTVDQLVQEDSQFAAGAVDDDARRLRLRRGKLLHSR